MSHKTMHNSHKREQGFTLIELLIVIGIIGFLAAAVLVAVDPVKRIQDARDSRRFSEANSVLNAILNKQVDRRRTVNGSASAPVIESATLAQVLVRSAVGVDCDTPASAPTCPDLPAGYSLATTNGVACVADLEHSINVGNNPTSVTVTTNGTPGTTTYTYAVVPVGSNGEMLPQVTGTVTTGAATLNSTDKNSVAFTTVPGATSYNIYRTVTSGTGAQASLGKIGNTATSPFDFDTGAASTTVAPQGAAGTTAWNYQITAVGISGETLAYMTGRTMLGNANLTGANFNRVTWDVVEGAMSYKVYRTVAGTSPNTTGLIASTGNLTVDDTGLSATGAVPTVDTSQSDNGITGTYINELPMDPIGSGQDANTAASDLVLGNNNTGYFIIRSPASHRVTIGACHGEQDSSIRVTR